MQNKSEVGISVVINTRNEAENLRKAVFSVVDWASEVVVVDMESEDGTADLARKLGARVFSHKKLEYVEPARNFAVSKAKFDWILVLDPDEIVPVSLAKKLKKVVREQKLSGDITYVRIPRKNMVFGKWMRYSRWWPDYNIRFFKKGAVKWSNQIHVQPKVKGKGLDLEAVLEMAIVHHHYDSISQFVQRMDRYTTQQLKVLQDNDYVFRWQDLVIKPMGEFLSRYFSGEGYKDGLHGLALAMLQSFSELVLYLKVWESGRFKQEELNLLEVRAVVNQVIKDLWWWMAKVFKGSGKWLAWLRCVFNRKIV